MDTRQISLFDLEPTPPPEDNLSAQPPVEPTSLEVQEPIVDFTTEDIAPEDPAAEQEAINPSEEDIGQARWVPGTGKKIGRGRFRLSDMENLKDIVSIPEDAVLFSKRYYSISEVADMFKVNISLIRFWENEFPQLKPKKNGKGDRLFRPEDIKNLKIIYHLLREKKYTIPGALDYLKKNKRAEENFEVIAELNKIKQFLLELKANL